MIASSNRHLFAFATKHFIPSMKTDVECGRSSRVGLGASLRIVAAGSDSSGPLTFLRLAFCGVTSQEKRVGAARGPFLVGGQLLKYFWLACSSPNYPFSIVFYFNKKTKRDFLFIYKTSL